MHLDLIERTDFDGLSPSPKNYFNVTFAAGVTCASFDIPITNDTESETNETIELTIMEKSLPFFITTDSNNEAEVIIVDNDCE